MRVFLSWSGERSRNVALILREWLADVVQTVQPWMSIDIEIGARWNLELSRELEASRAGIICVTRENTTAPWLLFEAGVLAKTVERSLVCPYLVDLRPSDISGPLAQFQSAVANEEDTFRIVKTFNQALAENKRTDSQLEKSFQLWWPTLQKSLAAIPDHPKRAPLRSDRELLEEAIDFLRRQARNEPIVSETEVASWHRHFDFRDAEIFAEAIDLNGSPVDPNAEAWAERSASEFGNKDLDGVWRSRWRVDSRSADSGEGERYSEGKPNGIPG